MSKFNSYVRKVDELARKAFKEYNEAADKLKRAEAQSREYPQRSGLVNTDYQVKSTRAHADYLEAKEQMDRAKRNMDSYNDNVAIIRKELAATLTDAFAADPSQIDTNVLTLLQSGILTADEYGRLMDVAAKADNHTMMRVIARFARTAADEVAKEYGQGDVTAKQLRTVAHRGSTDLATSKLQEFDALADIFRRTMRNTAMIGSWDQLAGPIVEGF